MPNFVYREALLRSRFPVSLGGATGVSAGATSSFHQLWLHHPLSACFLGTDDLYVLEPMKRPVLSWRPLLDVVPQCQLWRPASWKVMTSSVPSGFAEQHFSFLGEVLHSLFFFFCILCCFQLGLGNTFCCALHLLSLRHHDGERSGQRTNLLVCAKCLRVCAYVHR